MTFLSRHFLPFFLFLEIRQYNPYEQAWDTLKSTAAAYRSLFLFFITFSLFHFLTLHLMTAFFFSVCTTTDLCGKPFSTATYELSDVRPASNKSRCCIKSTLEGDTNFDVFRFDLWVFNEQFSTCSQSMLRQPCVYVCVNYSQAWTLLFILAINHFFLHTGHEDACVRRHTHTHTYIQHSGRWKAIFQALF